MSERSNGDKDYRSNITQQQNQHEQLHQQQQPDFPEVDATGGNSQTFPTWPLPCIPLFNEQKNQHQFSSVNLQQQHQHDQQQKHEIFLNMKRDVPTEQFGILGQGTTLSHLQSQPSSFEQHQDPSALHNLPVFNQNYNLQQMQTLPCSPQGDGINSSTFKFPKDNNILAQIPSFYPSEGGSQFISTAHSLNENEKKAINDTNSQSPNMSSLFVDDFSSIELFALDANDSKLGESPEPSIDEHHRRQLQNHQQGPQQQHKQQTSMVNYDLLSKSLNIQNERGFYPIHLACIHFPENAQLISTMLYTDPAACHRQVKTMSRISDSSLLGKTNDQNMPSSPKQQEKLLAGTRKRKLPVSNEFRNTWSNSSKKGKNILVGAYPIHIALANGASFEVVRLLSQQAPEVLGKGDTTGAVPLSIALHYNCRESIIHLLLTANPHATSIPDKRMNTPLHVACLNRPNSITGHLNVIKALLAVNKKPLEMRNFDGLTPIDLAQNSGWFDDATISYLHENAYKDEDVEEAPEI